MERFLCIVIALCALWTVSYSMQDYTPMDDEDTEQKRGMFTLELISQLPCSYWYVHNQVDTVKNIILDALVLAVNGSCGCDFTRQHIERDDISCALDSRDIFVLNGEISFVAESETSSMPELLRGVEEWAGSSPVFRSTFRLSEMVALPSTVTITMATTELVDMAGGSGEYSTTVAMVTRPTAPTATMITITMATTELVDMAGGSGEYSTTVAMVTRPTTLKATTMIAMVTRPTTSMIAPTTTMTTTMIAPTTTPTTMIMEKTSDVTTGQVNAIDQTQPTNSCYHDAVSLVTVIILIVRSLFDDIL